MSGQRRSEWNVFLFSIEQRRSVPCHDGICELNAFLIVLPMNDASSKDGGM